MKKLTVHVVMDDGTVHDTVTRTADYIAYEKEAKKQGWGGISDNPSTWEAFISYRALIRNRVISMPFSVFVEQADVVEASAPEEGKGEDNGEVTPFPKEVPAAS